MSGLLSCELCTADGGRPVYRTVAWRVVRPEDDAFPACYRVIWNQHAPEFSDLDARERLECMEAVATIEQVLRRSLAPTKVNLASLGNAVPHLHWHIIARFVWDSHFPQPIWGKAQRSAHPAARHRLGLSLADLDARVVAALSSLAPAAQG